jgi:hypothetical protein
MATFTTFLPHFASTMEHYLSRTTLDGYIREGDRAITYATRHYPGSWYTIWHIHPRRRTMPKFDTILQNERRLRSFTGLDRTTFMTFLPHFTIAMEQYLSRSTLDGYIREGDRAITYTNSPLPTPADRLLFILTYLKQNNIQEVHGQLFDMSQPNVSKWVRLLLDILEDTLAAQRLLPARTADELAAQLRDELIATDPESAPFFAMMGQNDQ